MAENTDPRRETVEKPEYADSAPPREEVSTPDDVAPANGIDE